jgi:uncharacterized protein (DUF952 family)
MAFVFHIAEQQVWEAAQAIGAYSHPSLITEGFIHCSTADQVTWVANQFMQGQTDLVLLVIETEKLQSELRYEEVAGVGSFPHIYGEINLDAVVSVLKFSPNAAGEFVLPSEVADL